MVKNNNNQTETRDEMKSVITIEFNECETSGDEQVYVERLHAHYAIKEVNVIERPYMRSDEDENYEESVVIEVKTLELSANEVFDIGYALEEVG